MISCTRPAVFANGGFQRWASHIQIYHIQSRTVRTRGGTNFYSDPLRRDERLLKRLEAQLANVQSKIKREQAESEALAKKHAHHGTQAQQETSALENHNFYFWGKVLTQEDRDKLTRNGIHSMNDLYSVYQNAETILSNPPFPKPDRLEPRLKYAYEMYKSIPEKVSQAGHKQAKSRFGGWF